jgi:glycosyltransferase involved in cell wall biosynthesis
MKVLVLSTKVPFIHGGAEELFDHLVRNLQATPGIEAEGFRLPFTWDPAERLIDEMLIARQLRLANIDRVIALKFPAYLVPWKNKVIWLIHQYRQAYDLLDAGKSNIPATSRGSEIVSAIRVADSVAFREANYIHTISPSVSQRLLQYSNYASSMLRQPLNDPEIFTGAEGQGYILATGRINAGKRQYLLIKALKYSPKTKLVIVGPPDSVDDAHYLYRLAREEGVEDRVTLDLRFLSRVELANFVNGARAVAYLPFDEDSLGYCTMEAFQAGKAVLTTTDSGGVLDIVRHQETGIIVSPDPQSVGDGMTILTDNPGLASRLGSAGRVAMDAQGLSWPTTIAKLLS